MVMLLFLLVMTTSAQEATPESTAGASTGSATITVSEQLATDGKITIDHISMPEDGWLAVNAVVNGQIGPTVGFTEVSEGEIDGAEVEIDTAEATPQLVATLHEDTGEKGKYEFNSDPSTDKAITSDDPSGSGAFRLTAISAWDQQITNDTVMIGSVISDQPTFVSVRADDSGKPGNVLGSAPVKAGTTGAVAVSIPGGTDANDVWVTLHTDAGTQGTFEFDGQSGADMPIVLDREEAQKEIRLEDHPVMMTASGEPIDSSYQPQLQVGSVSVSGDNTTGTLVVNQATSPVDGWVEVHVDSMGHPGKGLGMSQVKEGDNQNVNVDLDAKLIPSAAPDTIPTVVWAMLHIDDHEMGVFDHDMTPGADEPIVYNGVVMTIPVTVGTNAEATTSP